MSTAPADLKSIDIDTTLSHTLIGVIIIAIIIFIGIWMWSKLTLKDANCTKLKNTYDNIHSSLSNIVSNATYDIPTKSYLCNYYIKAAYNSCCGGLYKNDYVSLCALKYAIKSGARFLDFEIYSINNNPVISASSVDNYSIKQMYNYLDFGDVMQFINENAFAAMGTSNYQDPLILHFRISSKNCAIFEKMAIQLQEKLGYYLLDENYGNQNNNNNLGTEHIKNFTNKVIIMVDKTNTLWEDSPLNELVNAGTGGNSSNVHLKRASEVISTYNKSSDIAFNKSNMTIVLPDISAYNNNINSRACMNLGCQIVCMSFQNYDNNLKYYDSFFDDGGYAFKLQPDNMLYTTVKPDIKNTDVDTVFPGITEDP